MKLFLLEPEVVFQAQVNQISFTYPISQVTYDTAVGSFGDLERGLTILFGSASLGDDLGKAFVGPTEATDDTLYFNLSSQGKREGEVSLANDVHITVLNDYRVWPKTPDMPDGTVKYKWGTLEVGTNTTYTPPVANAGVPMAGEIDSGTGKLHAQFPPAATNSSFVTTEGATIAGYAWELPTGVTLSPGFALTDPVIEVDVDPGFYWLTLTVTDSNGKVHQARTFVLAIDPSDDPCITNIGSSTLRRSKETQTLSVEVFEDISKLDFPDGTLAVFIDGNPSTQDDRSNVLFWGWHQNDPGSVSSQREGFLTATTMTFVDVAGRLDVLPGFPQVIENEDIRDPEAHPSITWTHMVDPTLDKFIHYLLHWHSTALDLTDYIPSLTTTTYPIGGTLGSQGGSLWQQVTSRVKAFVPKRNIGCDKFGRLVVHMDPMTAPVAERTPLVQQHIGTDDMANIRWTSQTVPKYHWIRGSAIQSIDPLPLDENGDFTIPTFFCIAPGTAPGFGASEMSVGEQLAISQEDLNDATGHEYARQNAPFSVFDIELANPFSNTYYRHLDPVSMQWVTVTLEMQYAAQRGHALGVERGQLHEVVYEFRSQKEGVARKTSLRWEMETVGDPAITVIMPDVPAVGDAYTPPDPGEGAFLPNLPAGQEQVAIISNQESGGTTPYFIYKTDDFQTPSGSGGPTWTAIDLSATVTDAVFFSWVVDPFSPGYIGTGTAVNGWIAGETSLWYIEDIFGTCTATEQITFDNAISFLDKAQWRTVQASFGRYFEADADNPWVMVVSHYGGSGSKPGTWCSYSVDGGQTWSAEVRVAGGYYSTTPDETLPIAVWLSPRTPGLAYAMAFEDVANPPTGYGYMTTDWGATWKRAVVSLEDNPDEPLPQWINYFDNVASVEQGAITSNGTYKYVSTTEGTSGNGPPAATKLVPPCDVARIELSGTWNAIRDGELNRATNVASNWTNGYPTWWGGSNDFSFTGPADPGASSGSFTATITPYLGNQVPDSCDVAYMVATDDDGWDNPRIRGSVGASISGTGVWAYAEINWTLEVTEIELGDGTIYTPPNAQLLLPINGLGGSIHVPWQDNAAEALIYYGALTVAASRQFRTMQVSNGVLSDISPSDGSRSYGPNTYGFGIRAYDSDRQYLIMGAMGNDSTLDGSDDMHAVYVSDDAGATWTAIVGPRTDAYFSTHRGYQAAFSSDNPNVIYIWGEGDQLDRCIAYTSDFGATVDDRRGNLTTLFPAGSIDSLVGICGGPIA